MAWRRRSGLFCALALTVLTATFWIVTAPPALAQGGTLDLDLVSRIDGTAPFDTDDAPGNDSSASNGSARTHDTATWTWSVGLAGLAGDPRPTEVVLTQHLQSSDGAVFDVASLPTVCGTGINPATGQPFAPQSSIASGLVTCNLGAFDDGASTQVSITAIISGASPNGSTIDTSQTVRGFDVAGAEVVAAATHVAPAATSIVVSAEPRFDLDVERQPWIAGVEFHDGELGYRVVYYTSLRTIGDRGSERLPGSFGWTATLDTSTPGQIPNARIFDSADNCKRISDTQATFPDGAGGGPTRVTHSGTMTCTQPSHGAPVTVTIDGADTTGDHYPTTAPLNLFGFPSYVNGPYYVGTYLSQWFVPLSDIAAAGSVDLVFCLSNFDPDSAGGTSNFGTSYEPGWDGTVPSGDNCTTSTTLTTNSSFESEARYLTTTAVGGGYLCCDPTFYVPSQTNGRTGDGTVAAGDRFMAMQPMHNTGTEATSQFVSCLAIDNSVLRADPIDPVPNPWAGPNDVARLSLMATAEHDGAEYVLEYASGSNGGLPGGWNNDLGVAGPTPAGAMVGDFSGQRAATCDDADADPAWGWTTTTELDAPSGIPLDQITKVRVRLDDPASYQVPGGAIIRPRIGLVARSTFFGGPDDGAVIPPGTVLAVMSRWRVAELNGGDWSDADYDPNSHTGVAGDRFAHAGAAAPSTPAPSTTIPAPTTTIGTPTTTLPTPAAPPTTVTTPTTSAQPTVTTTTVVPGAGVESGADSRGPDGPLAFTGDDTDQQLQGAISLILLGILVLTIARTSRRASDRGPAGGRN